MEIKWNKDSQRIRRCRWCEVFIPVGDPSIALKNIDVSGKRVNIHFHDYCWDKMVPEMQRVRDEDE